MFINIKLNQIEIRRNDRLSAVQQIFFILPKSFVLDFYSNLYNSLENVINTKQLIQFNLILGN